LFLLLPLLPALTSVSAAQIKWDRYTTADGLPSNRILSVAADSDAVWVGTDHGLVLIHQGNIRTIFTTQDGLASDVVTALSFDGSTGDLWIATYGGVSCYSAGTFHNYTALASGLANDVVFDIAAKDGFVWAATATGLSRLNLRTGNWTNYDERNTPMIDPWPTRIVFANKAAYIATWGSGVLEYDLAADHWAQHRHSQTDNPNTISNGTSIRDFVTGVAFDASSNTLWVSSHDGLFRQNERSLEHYDPENSGLASGYINAIRLHGNELWILTDRGVSILDTKTGLWTAFLGSAASKGALQPASVKSRNGSASPTSLGQVFDVAFDGGEVWMATDNGLFLGHRDVLTDHAVLASSELHMGLSGGPGHLAQPASTKHTKQIGGSHIVNIGLYAPVDNSPDALRGLEMYHGAQLAVEEANSRAGQQSSAGKAIWAYALKVHNDSDPWGASTVEPVKMAIDENVIAVIGSIDGAATHTLLRISSELGFPVLNTATGDPTIRETGTPWLVHLLPDNRQQSRVLAKYILGQRRMRTLGIVRENARYARIGAEVLKEEIGRSRQLLFVEASFPSGATDFAKQIQQIRDAHVDGIVLWCQPEEGAPLLRQLRAAGIHVPAFGPNELASPQLISLGGAATEGFAAVSTLNPNRAGHDYEQFRRRFLNRFGEPASDYASYAYDAVNLLIAAVEKAGPDRDKVMDALRAYRASEWEGVTGKYLFDQRPNSTASLSMARVEGGRFVYWLPLK
jgi:branched-chain amino acid transport system substrate-binding protein